VRGGDDPPQLRELKFAALANLRQQFGVSAPAAEKEDSAPAVGAGRRPGLITRQPAPETKSPPKRAFSFFQNVLRCCAGDVCAAARCCS
jgi:hypothetical protein